MPTFRVRTFLVILAFSAFALLYISVGIRWHGYRARANLYARKEMEHTFEAASYDRAARDTGASDESRARAAAYKQQAERHRKAARECTGLREFYERCW